MAVDGEDAAFFVEFIDIMVYGVAAEGWLSKRCFSIGGR